MEADLIVHLTSSPERHCSSIQCVVPVKDTIYTGGRDGTIRAWEEGTAHQCRVYRGHTDWITSIVSIPDSNLLASSSHDSTIRLWDASDSHASLSFPSASIYYHTDYIEAMSMANAGKLLISAGLDQQLFGWDVSTLHADSKPSVRFSKLSSGSGKGDDNTPLSYYCLDTAASSPNIIAAGATDAIVRVWDARAPEAEVAQLGKTVQGSTVRALRISVDGQYVVSGGAEENAGVQLWDMRYIRLNKVAPVWNHDVFCGSSVWSIDTDSSFRHALVGGKKNQVAVLDLETCSVVSVHSFENEKDSCLQVLWVDCSGHDALADAYVSLSLTGLSKVSLSKKSDETLLITDPPVRHVKILSDGISVACQDSRENIHVWNVVTGKKTDLLFGNNGHVHGWDAFIENFTPEVCVHRWFTAEIHLGSLAVTLKNPNCFAAALFLSMDSALPVWCEGLAKVPASRDFTFTNLGEFKVNCGDMMLSRIFKILLEPSQGVEKEHLQQWTFSRTRRNTFELLNGYDVNDIEHIVPVWLLRAVLHKDYKLRDSKIRFELLPATGSGLSKLSKGERFTASDAITVRRVAMFVVNLLKHTHKDLNTYQEIVQKVSTSQRAKAINPASASGEEVDLSAIEMPESIVFVSCCGYILQPHQSLRCVKELIWNKNKGLKHSPYLKLHYSLRN
eukprot:TRINITY_DN6251_c0_g1_i1.p1 TRINITY_DN6251_c0_g1~~TRINITY_DN6251_c0_g1_i1.p1  ORF type:complete len:675 (+),score=102.90 TRINITY_DN6251_c0_g1_i1:53-2077(+)